WVRAGSDDAGRRDARIGNDAMSDGYAMSGQSAGASDHWKSRAQSRNVVVHRCNGRSTPQESTEDAVRWLIVKRAGSLEARLRFCKLSGFSKVLSRSQRRAPLLSGSRAQRN